MNPERLSSNYVFQPTNSRLNTALGSYTPLLRGSSMKRALVLLAALAASVAPLRLAVAQSDAKSSTAFTYEFYYKVKWGHFDEFLTLYKKNHRPILKKQIERGEILSISAAFPINHMGEDTRWDMRVTVVYRDAVVAHDDPSEAPWAVALFPNQKTFKKEEQRRFEMIEEHLDIPVHIESPDAW
jgi:hypothetical protein